MLLALVLGNRPQDMRSKIGVSGETPKVMTYKCSFQGPRRNSLGKLLILAPFVSKREKRQGIPLGRTSDITTHKHADGAQGRHDSVRYRPGEMRRGGGGAVGGGDWGDQKAQLWPADGATEIRGEVMASPRLPSAFPPALCPFTFHAPLMRLSRSQRPCELKRAPLPPQECMDLPAKV